MFVPKWTKPTIGFKVNLKWLKNEPFANNDFLFGSDMDKTNRWV